MATADSMRVRLHVPGVKVLEVCEDTPSALVVAVAVIRSWVRCSACGYKTRRVHQTKTTKVRDCPAFGRPVTLVWHRRRFRCNRCGATTTEGCAQFDRGLTLRFRSQLYGEVIASTVNRVRKTHHLAWSVVMTLVTERVTVLATQRRRRVARVICIDEKRLTKGHGPFSTMIYDGERGCVIGVIDGRSGESLTEWLTAQSPRWRRSVQVVVTDMATCWRSAIATALPGAAHVVDRFHVVRNAMSVLTEARRAAQRTQRGQPHRHNVYRARYTLATRCDRLSAAQHDELVALFDEHPHLAAAWELTQRFHLVFEADGIEAALDAVGELADAMARLHTGFAPGVRSLLGWETQWRNYHTTGGWTTNCAEGLNTKIELLERRCYGFRNTANHHTRILADCPGHHHLNQPPNLRSRPAGDSATTTHNHAVTR